METTPDTGRDVPVVRLNASLDGRLEAGSVRVAHTGNSVRSPSQPGASSLRSQRPSRAIRSTRALRRGQTGSQSRPWLTAGGDGSRSSNAAWSLWSRRDASAHAHRKHRPSLCSISETAASSPQNLH
jgi:hypothetical protein